MIRALCKAFGKEVIVLIDEYDVPLAHALENNYYDEMWEFIRTFLDCLKDNEALRFAVLTGCMLFTKESVYTGLNNFTNCTVYDCKYTDCCGFSPDEVKQLSALYDLESCYAQLTSWYDGYVFGGQQHLYCPWDVLSYLNAAQKNPEAEPLTYWANTASTALISRFIEKFSFDLADELETLFGGGSIEVKYDSNVSYGTLFDYAENFWMLLYFAGYLTECAAAESAGRKVLNLRFPNLEVKQVFADLIDHINLKLLPQGTVNDVIDACFAGDSSRISSLLSELLLSVISYFDYQELFYHAFVCGLFSGRAGIKVKSNLEQGLGRPDIAAERQRTRQGLIIECRYAAAPADLENRAEAALAQIDKLQYGAELSQRCRQVIKIGLAFCSKSCLAKCRLQTA